MDKQDNKNFLWSEKKSENFCSQIMKGIVAEVTGQAEHIYSIL